MPTGNTSCIRDGVSFNQFVLGCARSFGACITLRDEPMSTPIPKMFKPSAYHKKELQRVKKEIDALDRTTLRQAEKKAVIDYRKEVKSNQKYMDENSELKEKYVDMLNQIKAWKSPSKDHNEFKKFMIQQIETSIGFDCDNSYYTDNPPILFSGKEWINKKRKDLLWSLNYHTKEDMEERQRVAHRNDWINKLRNSLK